jgi:hypothetical protein
MSLPPDGWGPESSDVATRITREDLVVLGAVYERIARRADRLGAACVIGGLGIGVLLLTIAGPLGWPESLAPWLFALGWAIALGSTAVVWGWYRKAVARYDFRCPGCDRRVLKPTLRRAEAARVALAVTAGHCPSCGRSLRESEESP